MNLRMKVFTINSKRGYFSRPHNVYSTADWTFFCVFGKIYFHAIDLIKLTPNWSIKIQKKNKIWPWRRIHPIVFNQSDMLNWPKLSLTGASLSYKSVWAINRKDKGKALANRVWSQIGTHSILYISMGLGRLIIRWLTANDITDRAMTNHVVLI